MNKHIEDAQGKARFKNNSGVWLTRSIFFETSPSKDTVVYTLKDDDHIGYPSLYRLYMEANDPTEYSFAVQHLGGWLHWKLLRESEWFKPYYSAWRDELDTRFRAQAVANIMELADAPGKDKMAANKYIAEEGWNKPTPSRRTKVETDKIKKTANALVERDKRATVDHERLLN